MELSVIVPCFNEEANLPELADRVGEVFRVGRLEGAAELILVDDGSRDGTWRTIEGLTANHPFVVPKRHPVNRGIAAAWKTGLAAARGRLVCVIDADQGRLVARRVERLEHRGCRDNGDLMLRRAPPENHPHTELRHVRRVALRAAASLTPRWRAPYPRRW